MVFLPRFRFYFQLSEANNSYSSYIYFDLTIFCVDGIYLLITGFKWWVQTHARVFLAVQLNWYVIFMTRFLFLPMFLFFSPFTSKPFIFFFFFFAWSLFWSFFTDHWNYSNIGHYEISFFYLDFFFFFQLFQGNMSYFSYIYFDLTIGWICSHIFPDLRLVQIYCCSHIFPDLLLDEFVLLKYTFLWVDVFLRDSWRPSPY